MRTNKHFTLKKDPLQRSDFAEFVGMFKPDAIEERTQTWSEDNLDGRWRCYTFEELSKRDKLSMDLFWIKDKSLEDSENLEDPDVIANEIVEDLQAALEQFSAIVEELNGDKK